MRDPDPRPFPKHKDLAIPLQSLLLGGSLFLFLPFRCIGSCTAGLPCTTASAALVHRFLNRREKKKKGFFSAIKESMNKSGGCCGAGETCGAAPDASEGKVKKKTPPK